MSNDRGFAERGFADRGSGTLKKFSTQGFYILSAPIHTVTSFRSQNGYKLSIAFSAPIDNYRAKYSTGKIETVLTITYTIRCACNRHQRKISHRLVAQLPRTHCGRTDDINTKFSHLLLALLPRTNFTHSEAPNKHTGKTSRQNFRISYWHSYPEHTLHTARRQSSVAGRHQQGAKQECQEALSTAPATQTGLCVLRLPHRQEPRASGDQARRNPFWRLWVLRLPHRQ